MVDGNRQKAYLVEHFTTACILCGKIEYLEEIKAHIIKTYIEPGLLKMIKPTYLRKAPSVVTESQYQYKEQPEEVDGEDYYLAFVLKGEIRHTEQVKEYISTYSEKGVTLKMTPYSKEKQFIVGQ